MSLRHTQCRQHIQIVTVGDHQRVVRGSCGICRSINDPTASCSNRDSRFVGDIIAIPTAERLNGIVGGGDNGTVRRLETVVAPGGTNGKAHQLRIITDGVDPSTDLDVGKGIVRGRTCPTAEAAGLAGSPAPASRATARRGRPPCCQAAP